MAEKVNVTTIYLLSHHYDQVIDHLSVALLFTLHCRAARPTEQTRESLTGCVLGKLLFPLLYLYSRTFIPMQLFAFNGTIYLDKLPAGLFCITSGADSLRIVSALFGSFSRTLLFQGPIALLHLRGGTLVTIINLGFWWQSAKVHLYRLSLTLGDEDYRALLLVVLVAHFLLVRGEPKNKKHLEMCRNYEPSSTNGK